MFDIVYKVIHNEINFDIYIKDVVMNYLFKPFLNNINHECNFHDYFLGGMCKIMHYYLDNINQGIKVSYAPSMGPGPVFSEEQKRANCIKQLPLSFVI